MNSTSYLNPKFSTVPVIMWFHFLLLGLKRRSTSYWKTWVEAQLKTAVFLFFFFFRLSFTFFPPVNEVFQSRTIKASVLESFSKKLAFVCRLIFCFVSTK